MRTGTIAFLLGILILMQLPELPDIRFAWLIPVLLLACVRYPRARLAGFLACGFLWALLRSAASLDQTLPVALEGKSLLVEGTIVSLPERKGDSVRFLLRILQLETGSGGSWDTPFLTRVNWYGGHARVRPGERWQFRVRLKRPYGFMNPGGFDYEGWLFRQGIHATGYIQSGPDNRIIRTLEGNYADRLRFLLEQRIDQVTAGEQRALIKALVLGINGEITPRQWQVLKNSGTSHLLAISGQHITLIAGFSYFLARWLWSLSSRAVTWMPARRLAVLAGMLAATGYAAMAGFPVPTLRALIMLLLAALALLVYRRMAVSSIILAALAVLLILDPLAVLAADFWLSFAAVMIIAYGMSCRPGPVNLWWRWGRVPLLTGIGLAPLLVFWFQQVAVLTVLANIVAVPWIELVVVPCLLTGALLLPLIPVAGAWLLQIGASALQWLWPFLEWIAGTSFSVWTLPAPSWWAILAAMAGIIILLLPGGMPGRWIGSLWLLPMLFPVTASLKDGDFQFTLLDAGQGLAAVIATRQHVLVYDTGARFSERFDAGNAVLVPYLRQLGLRRIDTVIISHGDTDHSGGVEALLWQFPVGRILTSAPEAFGYPDREMCRDGQGWWWDGVEFRVIHPAAADRYTGNNLSCVLLVRSGEQAVLLVGDIEAVAERRIVEKHADLLHATVLVASHHGSRTSSAPEFIRAIAPDYVLFSVGYRNRFGFPNQDIIRRYQAAGARVMTTAREGAIRFERNGNEFTVRSYRRENKRFWHARAVD